MKTRYHDGSAARDGLCKNAAAKPERIGIEISGEITSSGAQIFTGRCAGYTAAGCRSRRDLWCAREIEDTHLLGLEQPVRGARPKRNYCVKLTFSKYLLHLRRLVDNNNYGSKRRGGHDDGLLSGWSGPAEGVEEYKLCGSVANFIGVSTGVLFCLRGVLWNVDIWAGCTHTEREIRSMQSEGLVKKRGKAVYVKQRRHVFDEVLSHLCCEFGIVRHVRTQRARPEENGCENGSQILCVLLPQRAAALLVVSPHTGEGGGTYVAIGGKLPGGVSVQQVK
jgi:hypothetical protein